MLIPSPIDTLNDVNIESPRPSEAIRSTVQQDAMSIVDEADDFHRRQSEQEAWAAQVRDPAENAAEGVRRVVSRNGRAYAEYQIARLPDGRYAVRTGCEYRGFAGTHAPWSVFSSREECVAEFLRYAKDFFGREIEGSSGGDSHRQGRRQILEQFEGTLFGFIEPDPASDNLPVIADELAEDE